MDLINVDYFNKLHLIGTLFGRAKQYVGVYRTGAISVQYLDAIFRKHKNIEVIDI